MKKPSKISVSIEDRLLSQDRWIMFLILLGSIAISTIIYQAHQLEDLKTENPELSLRVLTHEY